MSEQLDLFRTKASPDKDLPSHFKQTAWSCPTCATLTWRGEGEGESALYWCPGCEVHWNHWSSSFHQDTSDERKTRVPDGTPHVRDVDSPCDDYEPGMPDGRCGDATLREQGDGHYLCVKCKKASRILTPREGGR